MKATAKNKRRPKREVPKKSSAVKKAKPKIQEEPQVVTRYQPPTGEINNIIADTIERIYEEFGGKLDRVNAEDKAMLVTRLLKHGASEQGLITTPKITEKSMNVPLCSTCSGDE